VEWRALGAILAGLIGVGWAFGNGDLRGDGGGLLDVLALQRGDHSVEKRAGAAAFDGVLELLECHADAHRSVIFEVHAIDDLGIQNGGFVVVGELHSEAIFDGNGFGAETMGKDSEAHSPTAEINQFDSELGRGLGTIAQNPMGRDFPDNEAKRDFAGRGDAKMRPALAVGIRGLIGVFHVGDHCIV
jgi:hypothetical protein